MARYVYILLVYRRIPHKCVLHYAARSCINTFNHNISIANYCFHVWCGISNSSSTSNAPETFLKKRRAAERYAAAHASENDTRKKKASDSAKELLKRAEQYVAEYRAAEQDLIRQRRIARDEGKFFVEPEAKLAFVVRIRGINGMQHSSCCCKYVYTLTFCTLL